MKLSEALFNVFLLIILGIVGIGMFYLFAKPQTPDERYRADCSQLSEMTGRPTIYTATYGCWIQGTDGEWERVSKP